ncbi:MAG: fatty acid--CoA ligase family protein [bacterium]
MSIDFLIEIFDKNKHKDAIIWGDKVYTYKWLIKNIDYWQKTIKSEGIKKGTAVVLEADFSPNSIALFLALIECGCIIIPLADSVRLNKDEFIGIAQGEVSIRINKKDKIEIIKLSNSANNEFYNKLKKLCHPGLILFSSGSTGKNKAVVHDLVKILEKFKTPRNSLRAITFLLYDHIGGINTIFYILSNAGCIVTVKERTPDTVLETVEKYQVELLPTSPTFINLILLSEAYKRHNIDSLKTISYGTEPMLESTLKRFHKLFPDIHLQQTYGLSEVGILRSKSENSNSLWMKIGGEGFQTRIVDGILHIKAESSMLGYLNSPNPFTKDGWFNTGDSVEVKGEYIKILGRKSEIINVGGEKVYPVEIENVIQKMSNIAEVTVYGEKNLITGNIVCVKVKLLSYEDIKKFTIRLRKHCYKNLERFKVPTKIFITDKEQYNERFKKLRK